MKCQFFPFLGVFFALAFAPGLTSVHAAGETALDNGMYKVTIGREIKIPCGCDVGRSMGVNTRAAFAGTPDDALVVGDSQSWRANCRRS